MINNIYLKFGPTGEDSKLNFKPAEINLFIGPNNAGKSKALAELVSFLNKGKFDSDFVIFQKIEFEIPTESQLIEMINCLKIDEEEHIENFNGREIKIGRLKLPGNNFENRIIHTGHLSAIRNNINSNDGSCEYYVSNIVTLLVLNIVGNARFTLLTKNSLSNLQEQPGNYLTHIFQNNELRKEIRDTIYKAFKKYFILDPSFDLGKVMIKFSDIEPESEIIEKGIHQEAVEFHKKARFITKFSDGVKAYTSIILALKAIEPKILIIDEPEAFLHPSLANMLGKEIGKNVLGKSLQFYAATHSSEFLMGLVTSGAPINLIRLTYLNEFPTARILPKERIVKLMRDPLLRSAGVLRGLFYEAVIVTESDADRAFYQEINERLLTYKDEGGIKNCLFLNAQNKQTVFKIVKPLRELGIPTVGIVDIDILKDGGHDWNKVIYGAHIDESLKESLTILKNTLKRKFEESGQNMKRDGGIEILSASDKVSCQSFFDQLKQYGVFIVPNGELESWLSSFNITGHGPEWLIKMFERMKEDPNDTDYVKPKDNDVWEFIYEIKKWIENPQRKGIPVEDVAITTPEEMNTAPEIENDSD